MFIQWMVFFLLCLELLVQGSVSWAADKEGVCQTALTVVTPISTNKIRELGAERISFGSGLEEGVGILADDTSKNQALQYEESLMKSRTRRLFKIPRTEGILAMESNRVDDVRITPEGRFLFVTDRSRHRPSRIVPVPEFYKKLSYEEARNWVLRLQDEPAVTDQVLNGSIIASLPDMSLMIVDSAFLEAERSSRDLGDYLMYFPDLQITRWKNAKIRSKNLQGWDEILAKLRLAAQKGMILKRNGMKPQITADGHYLTINLEIYSSKTQIAGYSGEVPAQVLHPYTQNLVVLWDLEKNELVQHFMSNSLDSEEDAETTSGTALLPQPTDKRVFATKLLENGDVIVARAHTQKLRDEARVPTVDVFLKLVRLSPHSGRESQIFGTKIEGLPMENGTTIGIPYVSGGVRSISISRDGKRLLLKTTAPAPQDKVEVDISGL